jgi:hypothetical protein
LTVASLTVCCEREKGSAELNRNIINIKFNIFGIVVDTIKESAAAGGAW